MGKNTKIIVGLGNPGKKYVLTRHNIGFMVVENLAKDMGAVFRRRFMLKADVALVNDVIFVKPYTFMNLSGNAVVSVMKKYAVEAHNVMVVCDDLNLNFGNVRIRLKGSAGGHNGLKSLIAKMQTQEFPRIRYGIGESKAKDDTRNFVLDKFSGDELKEVKQGIEKIVSSCKDWISDIPLEKIMSKVNVKNEVDD